jgi:hypothetical protein
MLCVQTDKVLKNTFVNNAVVTAAWRWKPHKYKAQLSHTRAKQINLTVLPNDFNSVPYSKLWCRVM